LNKLVPSPRNVRRTADEQADFQLKADIEARGLLQNLVVTGAAKPRGSFAVEAGGRRLDALKRLAEEGKLPKTHEVSCLVLEGGATEAKEASLAENLQRLSMNPADECLAFQQMIEQGSDVEGVARRFGLTVRFVEGRLRLATLAPIVFEALGAGEISLDVAKAYATTPDQERQAHVFEQMSSGYGAAHPDIIRRMMTQATASATDRRARLVGEEAYVAAGGRIERDLFADDAATRWLDIAILERLACERMETLAAEAAAEAGLGWVRPTLDHWLGGAHTAGLLRVPVETPPLTDEESALVDALEAEIEEIALGFEDEEMGEEARDAGEARICGLSDRIDAIVKKPPVIDDALKPRLGAFLMLDEHGRPRLDTGLYAEITADGEEAALDDEDDGAPEPDPKPGRAAGLSQRLVDELAMQRRDILAVHVAADPGLALDLAIFLMIDREVGYSSEKSGSSLVAMPPSNPVVDFKTPEAAATLARDEAAEALDRSWAAGASRAERFDAFRALCDDARAAWLGHAVARTLEASLNLPGQRACGFHDHLGQLLGINVARWWRPTGTNYFDRVPKSVTLAALAEIGGPALAGRYAGARKAELAQGCERIFSGDVIAEVEVKEAALAWVPDAMRFAPPAVAEAEPANVPNAENGDGEDSGGESTAPVVKPMEEAA
ncbi:MAG TPA: ParB/RepB/Spo0J family partition protein, partial [Allosphingosinicella sp.]|nr:ParB/RepB/Spo0J family partition protein [Allosphingosinicella sp.]